MVRSVTEPKMKSLFRLCAELLLGACALPLFGQELQNLNDAVKAAGLTPVIDGGTFGYHYPNATLNPTNAFNGVTYSTSTSARWLGSIQRGTYLRYALPDGFPATFVVEAYRLHSLSSDPGNISNARARAPRSWALYGHTDATAAADADGWVLLDERSDVKWPFETGEYDASVTGSQYIMEGTIASPDNYRAYKFVPLSSNKPGDTWSTGLMELVFSGRHHFRDSIYVTAVPDLLEGVTPGYGNLDLSGGTNITISASEYCYTNSIRYRCAGYYTETLDASGAWILEGTNANARSYTTVSDGTARRLTWLWEEDGYLLSATPEGSGSETVTYVPEAEADGYYAAGTQVSVTANGATDPVSTFRNWSGDVPEGAAESTVTLTMDAPKTLVANFQRRWKYVAKTDDMPYAAVTDGNWTLFIAENGTGYRTMLVNSTVNTAAATGSGILDITTLYEDTSAQGTPIHLNYFCYNAFNGNTGVTGLILGEQSIEFGQYAFQNCTALTFIEMPEEVPVTFSGTEVFRSCTALKTVKLSNQIEDLPGMLFGECTALETVTPLIPRDTVSAGSSYQGCTSLRGTPDVRFIKAITGYGLFANCSGITGDLDFQSLETFTAVNNAKGAFENTGITSVRLPVATEIPWHAFCGCTSLTNVAADSVTTLGSSAFGGCTSLKSVELPSLRTIGPYAFNNCTSFSSFTGGIPGGLETIGDYAFQTCTALTAMGSMRFPKTLKSIGYRSFRQATFDELDFSLTQMVEIPQTCFSMASFRSIILPKTLTTINETAFNGMKQFTSIYFCGPPPASLNSSWNRDSLYKIRVYVSVAPTCGWTDVIDPEVANYSGKANYATVVEDPDLIGVWSDAWAFRWTPPNADTQTTVIRIH